MEKNINFIYTYLKYANVLSHSTSNYLISTYILVNFKSPVFLQKIIFFKSTYFLLLYLLTINIL